MSAQSLLWGPLLQATFKSFRISSSQQLQPPTMPPSKNTARRLQPYTKADFDFWRNIFMNVNTEGVSDLIYTAYCLNLTFESLSHSLLNSES